MRVKGPQTQNSKPMKLPRNKKLDLTLDYKGRLPSLAELTTSRALEFCSSAPDITSSLGREGAIKPLLIALHAAATQTKPVKKPP